MTNNRNMYTLFLFKYLHKTILVATKNMGYIKVMSLKANGMKLESKKSKTSDKNNKIVTIIFIILASLKRLHIL